MVPPALAHLLLLLRLRLCKALRLRVRIRGSDAPAVMPLLQVLLVVVVVAVLVHELLEAGVVLLRVIISGAEIISGARMSTGLEEVIKPAAARGGAAAAAVGLSETRVAAYYRPQLQLVLDIQRRACLVREFAAPIRRRKRRYGRRLAGGRRDYMRMRMRMRMRASSGEPPPCLMRQRMRLCVPALRDGGGVCVCGCVRVCVRVLHPRSVDG